MSDIGTMVKIMKLDDSQQTVVDLNPQRHATVLGAPGTGKTTLIIEAAVRELEQGTQPLVLAGQRRAAARIREAIEQRTAATILGTPVRTPSSFAFSVLAHHAALRGAPAPVLATGALQDEAIRAAMLSYRVDGRPYFAPELVESASFRTEVRDLWRVCDDYRVAPRRLGDFSERLASYAGAGVQVNQWVHLGAVIAEAEKTLAAEAKLTVSQVLARAAELVYKLPEQERDLLPARIMVDDAENLTEGALGLLAACAARGTAVWLFGDPDVATSAFQGERTDALKNLGAAFERKWRRALDGEALDAARSTLRHGEQRHVLQVIHRGTSELRRLAQSVTAGIGTSGVVQQRAAYFNDTDTDTGTGVISKKSVAAVEAVALDSPSAVTGALAHRLKAHRYGPDWDRTCRWQNMAVIVRSRQEAETLARNLQHAGVPTRVLGGGIRLREHRIVRDLLTMLQHALGSVTLNAASLNELLTGPVGQLDALSLRRLRYALLLEERTLAQSEQRAPRRVDEVIFAHFESGARQPLSDTRAARRLQRLLNGMNASQRLLATKPTPRELLWQIWDHAHIAEQLQETALGGEGEQAFAADEALDAVLALFFVFERLENTQETDVTVEQLTQLIEEIMFSDIPEDTLAPTSDADAVLIGTPQGVAGAEFSLVCVTGLNEGNWPNLKPRGQLLGITLLERFLRGEETALDTRTQTLHDELRLLLYAITRATEELFVVNLSTDEVFPSPFWESFSSYVVESVPSSGLSLRGTVAAYRKALEQMPENTTAAQELAFLAEHGVPGADPDQWYGVKVSHETFELTHRDGQLALSPTGIGNIEQCPLNWLMRRLQGNTPSDQHAGMGTLLHHVFEIMSDQGATRGEGATLTVGNGDEPRIDFKNYSANDILAAVWPRLDPAAERTDINPEIADYRNSEAAIVVAQLMPHIEELVSSGGWERDALIFETLSKVQSMRAYHTSARAAGWEVAGVEMDLNFEVNGVTVRGRADRVEVKHEADKTLVRVVDLKTGSRTPSIQEAQNNAQLRSYQVGVQTKGLEIDSEQPLEAAGATLLFVHPKLSGASGFSQRSQDPLAEANQQEFEQRVAAAAERVSGVTFTAEVEHHCSDTQDHYRSCALHIIPPVSHS